MAKQLRATCAVLICTRNRPMELARCLAAVQKLTYPRFEILVVDSAPVDARSFEVARGLGVRYLLEPTPGASRARNVGSRACQTDIVAILDDEAVPEPDWLSGLVREFEDPMVMAVAGRILTFEAETDEERVCAAVGSFDCGDERRVIDQTCPQWFERSSFGGVGNGGSMAFRRSAFDFWSGFSERMGPGTPLIGGEEHYAFFSLVDMGFRVAYTPRAIVYHPYPENLVHLRKRHLTFHAASTGYMTMLFFEQPSYRRAILKYAWEALRGKRRSWRGPAPNYNIRLASRSRVLLAWLSGPFLYFRARYLY